MKKKIAKKAAIKNTPQKIWADELIVIVRELMAAARDDEVKGGGDPADFEVIEKNLELQQVRFDAHMEKFFRQFES